VRQFINIFLLLTILSGKSLGQNANSSFTLNGQINIDTGTVKLIAVGNESYYPKNHGYYVAQVKGGKFTISDSILYTYGFRLLLLSGGDYVSDYFFVDSGIQSITCNLDSSRKIPVLSNLPMSELKESYMKGFDSIKQESYDQDSRHQNTRSYLLTYARAHPDSYVALWKLIIELKFGYAGILDSVYSEFSSALKRTHTGIVLAENLQTTRNTTIGYQFPTLKLFDEQHKKTIFPILKNRYKYTFVDFWFSHCAPCLSEFPRIKQIYNTHKSDDFQIAAISTDFSNDIPEWKKVIKERQLNWTQLLDENGAMAKKYSIESFPTNFLLDEKGVIIKKNITPDQLEEFLISAKYRPVAPKDSKNQ
jgi:thiol-disulfide isomerase/thioredoxin